MKISVTAEHIDKGKRGDPCSCPFALAIKEVVGDAEVYIRIAYNCFATFVDVQINNWDYRVANRFIARDLKQYDNTGKLNPFEIEIPYEKTQTCA